MVSIAELNTGIIAREKALTLRSLASMIGFLTGEPPARLNHMADAIIEKNNDIAPDLRGPWENTVYALSAKSDSVGFDDFTITSVNHTMRKAVESAIKDGVSRHDAQESVIRQFSVRQHTGQTFG